MPTFLLICQNCNKQLQRSFFNKQSTKSEDKDKLRQNYKKQSFLYKSNIYFCQCKIIKLIVLFIYINTKTQTCNYHPINYKKIYLIIIQNLLINITTQQFQFYCLLKINLLLYFLQQIKPYKKSIFRSESVHQAYIPTMIDDEQQDDTILFINRSKNITPKKMNNIPSHKTNINSRKKNLNRQKIKLNNLKFKTQQQDQDYFNYGQVFLGLKQKQPFQTFQKYQKQPLKKLSIQQQQQQITQRDCQNQQGNNKWQGNTFYSNIKKKIHQKLRTEPINNICKFGDNGETKITSQKIKSKLTISTLQIALDPMCKKLMDRPFQIERKIYRKIQSNVSMVKTNPNKMIRNLSAKVVRDSHLKSKFQQIQQNNDKSSINQINISKSQRKIPTNQYSQTCRRKNSKNDGNFQLGLKNKNINLKNKQPKLDQKNDQQQEIRKSIKTEHTKSIQGDISQTFINQYKKKLRMKRFDADCQNSNMNSNCNQFDRAQNQKFQNGLQVNKETIKNHQPNDHNSSIKIEQKYQQNSQIILQQKETHQASNKNTNPPLLIQEKLKQTSSQFYPKADSLANNTGSSNNLKKSGSVTKQTQTKSKSPLKIQTFDTNPLLFYFKARNNIKISNRQISIKKIRVKSSAKPVNKQGFV